MIGLGAMGLPMATHLATTFAVTGFEPFAPRREQAEEPASPSSRPRRRPARDADIALLAVRDQAQAETALFGPDGVLETLRPGSPVILTSTVGPDAARDTRRQAGAAGYSTRRRADQRRPGAGRQR